MESIKKLVIVFGLLMFVCFPVLAEQSEQDASHGKAEVFINSNALNSKIRIEVNDEIVSGPGNKVLAVVPLGATFKIITEAAEGSEAMAMDVKLRDTSGEVAEITPEYTENNVRVYKMPQNADGVSGAVFFGNSNENSKEEATVFVAEASNENVAKRTIIDAENKIEAINEPIIENETPIPVAEIEADTKGSNQASSVSEPSEIPNTGVGDAMDFVPLFLCAMMVAAVTLWANRHHSIDENTKE